MPLKPAAEAGKKGMRFRKVAEQRVIKQGHEMNLKQRSHNLVIPNEFHRP